MSPMSSHLIRDLSLRHIDPWDLFPQHDPSCLPTWSETYLCVIFIPGTSSRNMTPHVSQPDQRLVSATRSALVNIRREALSPLMIFTQGRTVFCFYIRHTQMIFQAGNHLWKCKFLQFKRKKIGMKGKRIRTHDLNYLYTTLTIH